MRTSVCLISTLALCLGACFDVPVLVSRDVGVRDAPPRREPVPLEVVAVRVLDASGRSWPLDGAPRRPAIELELTAPLEPDAETIVLVRGEPDDALLDDLEGRPLTAATRARSVPSDVVIDERRVRITPRAALVPNEVLALGLAAFATSIDGEPLGRPRLERLFISGDPSAGASVIASFPADGTVDVPPNAEPFVLALDGTVVVRGEPVVLRSREHVLPTATTIARCSPLGLEAVECLRVAPRDELPRGASLVLETTAALRDATGAEVPTSSVQLTTSLEADARHPSVIAPSRCAIDARPEHASGCVLDSDWSWRMEIAVDEPVRIEVARSAGVLRWLAPRGLATLTIDELAPGTNEPATLVLVDLAGLRASVPIVITTAPLLPSVTITEVCANPVGAEPDQEWVEVTNVGDLPVQLADMRISDGDDDVGTSLGLGRTLVPGARVLLVGEGFDADAAGVPPGAPLLVVGRTIVSSGIANSGEPLYLRGADGRRLASVPALAAREGACVVRNAEAHARADAIDDFHYDACSPGR